MSIANLRTGTSYRWFDSVPPPPRRPIYFVVTSDASAPLRVLYSGRVIAAEVAATRHSPLRILLMAGRAVRRVSLGLNVSLFHIGVRGLATGSG